MKLELKGFTSYRERTEIDFRRFDLFAITGQTGAGKTSLLDAMTYALYGKTSRLNRAGKDLISQGGSAMSVSLHFRAGCDEYRVSRAMHWSTATPWSPATTTVRLEKLEQGKWHIVTGGAGEIGQRVERIIGLDFDAFTKSVILPQGKFDQFLRGSRKEQRETLNDLLDVEVYQRMVQSANGKKSVAAELASAKQAELDPAATGEAKAEYDRELAALAAEEERAADAVAGLQQALPHALTLREKRRARQAAGVELRATRTRMAEAEAARRNALRERDCRHAVVEALKHEIALLRYDGESHVRLARTEEKAIQRDQRITELAFQQRKRSIEETKLEAAEKAVSAGEKSLARGTARLAETEELRRSAKAAFSELTSRHGSADAAEQAADELDQSRSADGEIPKLREALACLEARAAASPAEGEAARRAVAEAETEGEGALARYEHWRARDRAAGLRHDLKPGDPCPVCEQTVQSLPTPPDARELARARGRWDAAELALEKRRAGLAAWRAEADALPGRIDLERRKCELLRSAGESAAGRASRILGIPANGSAPGREDDRRRKTIVRPTSGAASLLRVLSERIRTAESAAMEAQASYERALGDERRAAQALQDGQHNRKLILSQIANIDDQAVSLRKEIARLEEDLPGAQPLPQIAAQVRVLDDARQKCAALEASLSGRQNELKQAEESAVRCAKDVEALQNAEIKCATAIEELDLEIGREREQVRGLLGSLKLKAPDSQDEAAQIASVRVAAQKDLEAAQARVQRCRFANQSIDEKIARNQRLGEEIARYQAEEALYRDLATWLNAGNFQQYLMNSAFERLAHEGSRHLKELSNGRYTFVYNAREFQAIDKWNGDEARSVNTLSGGESFLASLSLALALAESIAELNPAGGAVALESLFLDEGFSTLDAESQSRVADALQVLQGGTRLIGVITHVQALADQMPARIEIERTLSGSRVRQVKE
ncbi:MAG TPA: SMC family ATPase [Candidatus Acidoferrales bacterium]|nr:SMC family ATPase [Candidatus Acidoferrales bacterium]